MWHYFNYNIMARVAGITVEKSYSGHPTYIKFDYNKYGGLLHSFFIQNEIEIPLIPNEKTNEAIKDATRNYKKFKVYNSAESLLADCLKD